MGDEEIIGEYLGFVMKRRPFSMADIESVGDIEAFVKRARGEVEMERNLREANGC